MNGDLLRLRRHPRPPAAAFTEQDTATANRRHRYQPDPRQAIAQGKTPSATTFGFEDGGGADFEIVGVVEDTAYNRSLERPRHVLRPCHAASAERQGPNHGRHVLYVGALVVQTDRPMNDMESIARKTLGAINPNLTIVKFQTFDQQIADTFIAGAHARPPHHALRQHSLLMLATIGIYGVTAYNVARRTPEIGIRMALGAERGGVVAMVMKGAFIQTALGLAIGIPIALLCVRFIKSQLYEITSANTTVVLGAILTLAIAGCVAAILPARRAANTDPVQALRME